MMKRIVLGGIAGAVTLFIWGFLSNMVLRLGETGIRYTGHAATDTAIADSLKEHLAEPGLYVIPGVHDAGLTGDEKTKAVEDWASRYQAGPTAFLIFHPTGQSPISPQQLGLQFLVCFVTATIVSALLSCASASLATYPRRLVFVLSLSLLAFVFSQVPWYIWWRFPSDYMMGVLLDQSIGFLLLGVVLAAIVRPVKSEAPTVPDASHV